MADKKIEEESEEDKLFAQQGDRLAQQRVKQDPQGNTLQNNVNSAPKLPPRDSEDRKEIKQKLWADLNEMAKSNKWLKDQIENKRGYFKPDFLVGEVGLESVKQLKDELNVELSSLSGEKKDQVQAAFNLVDKALAHDLSAAHKQDISGSLSSPTRSMPIESPPPAVAQKIASNKPPAPPPRDSEDQEKIKQKLWADLTVMFESKTNKWLTDQMDNKRGYFKHDLLVGEVGLKNMKQLKDELNVELSSLSGEKKDQVQAVFNLVDKALAHDLSAAHKQDISGSLSSPPRSMPTESPPPAVAQKIASNKPPAPSPRDSKDQEKIKQKLWADLAEMVKSNKWLKSSMGSGYFTHQDLVGDVGVKKMGYIKSELDVQLSRPVPHASEIRQVSDLVNKAYKDSNALQGRDISDYLSSPPPLTPNVNSTISAAPSSSPKPLPVSKPVAVQQPPISVLEAGGVSLPTMQQLVDMPSNNPVPKPVPKVEDPGSANKAMGVKANDRKAENGIFKKLRERMGLKPIGGGGGERVRQLNERNEHSPTPGMRVPYK